MDEVDHDRTREQSAGRTEPVAPPLGVPELARPGDPLRSLPDEARRRGTRLVSSRAMQARLFSVYDAAAAAEEALALVQEQLTLTLNRSYYEADEIESTAARLDELLIPPNPALASTTTSSATTPSTAASDFAEISDAPASWQDVDGVDADTSGDSSLTE